MGGDNMKFPILAGWGNVEESGQGRETVIDGVNKSQRMMGDESRGMCESVLGAGVSVMK